MIDLSNQGQGLNSSRLIDIFSLRTFENFQKEVFEGCKVLIMASVRAAKNQLTTPTQHSRFELGVCMAVYSWENLTVAVQSGWGGPDSADKRDWLTGSIVELYGMTDLQ